jgi:hypothetical protein
MLCQFTYKNFKSYKNETILDFQAFNKQNFSDSLLKSGDDKNKFIPVSVIYGPNGGGKSNVLDAVNCIVSLVMKPILIFKNKVIQRGSVEWTPFLFDETSRNEPTEFELYFRPNDEYEYRYSLTLISGKIEEEYLYRRKIGKGSKIATIFERTAKGIQLGASINKKKINIEVNDQMPYLSFLYINYKLDPIILAIDWFEKCIIRNYANPKTEQQLILGEGEAFKQKLIMLMNEVGINISNFNFVKKADDDTSYDLIFEHTVNGKTYPLNINQESDGTQKLFNVLPLVIIALAEGRLLVIDELDAKLHPKLLKFIIMLFKNPEINIRNAQLIFTSHDVSIMKSSVFRTDEIWFACKLDDESSDLYSLYELRDENENHIQPSAAYDKQYLEGRYGADPYFRNMMDWK